MDGRKDNLFNSRSARVQNMFVKHLVLPIEVRQKVIAKFSKLEFTKSSYELQYFV